MSKLSVVVVSTRSTRIGHHVGQWFFERARAHGKFDASLVDLKEHDLPVFDEPKHPRLGDYEHEHTKRWSQVVGASDAFVFVTPEYNYSTPPSFINALDFLSKEWAYKPASFVSYGGVSGGIRAVQMAKLVLTSLKMMPIPEAVGIPSVTQFLQDGVFKGTEAHEKSAIVALDELYKWSGALEALRK